MTIAQHQKSVKKAYQVYLVALNQAEGNLIKAALIADKKGYNWTVDYQDSWYDAVKNCSFETY